MTTMIDTPSGTAQPYRWRWAALAVILAAEVMDLLDATIVHVAAPTIRHDLGAGASAIQWIAATYTLAMAIGLITGGRLGDVFGRRRMFLTGAAGFVVSSLLCGLAPSAEILVANRFLQGLFGAIMIPQGFGMIKEMFPPKQLGAAFAMFGPVMGLSSVGGPLLAGWLIDLDLLGLDWRTIFLINLPLGLVTLAAAARFLPHGSRAAIRPRLDLTGVALAASGSLLVVFPLVQGPELGWPSWVFGVMATGVAAFAVLAVWVRRADSPLIQPSLFRKRAYTGGLIVGVLFFGLVTGFLLVLNLFTQTRLGYSPLDAGLATVPMSLGIAIGSGGGFALAAKIGRRVLHLALAVTALGVFILYATLPGPGQSAWLLVPGVFVGGLGMGLMMAPLFSFILAAVDDHEVGSASGVLSAVQQLGSSVGVAALGTLFFAGTFGGTALAMGVAIAITFGLVFLLPVQARQDAH